MHGSSATNVPDRACVSLRTPSRRESGTARRRAPFSGASYSFDSVKTHKGTAGGWIGILRVLKQQLETGDIPSKTKLTYALMAAMMFMLPKATKVDEVAKAGW